MIKKMTYALAALSLVACAEKNPYEHSQNTPQDYPVVPLPEKLTQHEGKFWLNAQTRIEAPQELEKEAQFLREYVELQTKLKLSVEATSSPKNNVIELQTTDAITAEEGYVLDITPNRIKVQGKTAAGVFLGIQTLRQLILPQENKDFTIACATIEDAPRFAYRGMHLDVGRHLFPMDFIKKYIDLLALHKMNTFHWHLTEDQGWRLEIKKYPKLTEIGAWRAETAIKKHFPGSGLPDDSFQGDGTPYGGFYTQDQAREIVQYAADRHITVIPEIDMPGHMLAALASYPELGNGTGPYKVAEWWGVFSQILAPKEETFTFLENVLTEVMEIFPSTYIHIGGDEAPKKEWKASAQAQALIKKLGLTDDTQPNPIDGKKHTKEEKLQSYFIQRIEKFINSKGRQIIGWDEILEGGLAPNATVMSWRGTEGGIAAAKTGHKAIMTPGDFCYFDHYQTQQDHDTQTPFGICCLTTVEQVYSYNPIAAELTPEQQKYIWGVQANLWTEYIATPEHAEYMIAPRMSALSEVAWTAPEQKNYPEFVQRLTPIKNIMDLMNVNYAKHIFQE